MKNLTPEQRRQIAIEEFQKEPLESLCHVAIIKLAEFAISTNAEEATQSIKATFNKKRYEIKTVTTYKEI